MALRRAVYQRLLSPHIPRLFSHHAITPPPLRTAERRVFQPPLPPDRLPLPLPFFDGLPPPPRSMEGGISAEEARKVLRAAQMEAARARLRSMRRSSVSHAEFVRVCGEAVGSAENGRGLARALDDAGAVIVLGDLVLLRPDQVAKAIESVITPPASQHNDAQRKELKEMEERKAEIDVKAERRVKRELWCGLALFSLQTVGFMRLTFWEFTWDVMEPLCFFVSSLYFIAGYAFFMRTSRDPSFQGFFDSRFAAKQRRLMRAHKFDLQKFNELKKIFPSSVVCEGEGIFSSSSSSSSSSYYCDCPRRSTLIGAGR